MIINIMFITLIVMFDLLISVICFACNLNHKDDYYAGFPKYWCEHTKLNAFGATLVFLFLFCIAPVYYLLWFGYWLVHVGKNKNFKCFRLKRGKNYKSFSRLTRRKNKQKEIDQYFQSHCRNNEAMSQREEFPNRNSAKCDNCQYAKYCLTHLENASVTGCTTGFPGGMAIANTTELEQKAVEQLERVSSMLGVIGETEDYTEIAIHALEENRIYHALGTPEELRKKLEEPEAEVEEFHKRR